MRAPAATGVQRIIPDGCPEIILNSGDHIDRIDSGAPRRQPRAIAVGQLRSAMLIRPTGAVDLLGVRFEPAGLHALSSIPMNALVSTDAALRDVSRRLHDRLDAALAHAPGSNPLDRVAAALMRELDDPARTPARHTWIAHEALARMRHAPTQRIETIARHMRASRRTIERAFIHEIGLSPKQLARVFRVSGLARELAQGRPAGGWARAAASHGYADQAHLIRDFKSLAGVTPEQYLREQGGFAGCFHSA